LEEEPEEEDLRNYCSICHITKLTVIIPVKSVWNRYQTGPLVNMNTCNMCRRLNPTEEEAKTPTKTMPVMSGIPKNFGANK